MAEQPEKERAKEKENSSSSAEKPEKRGLLAALVDKRRADRAALLKADGKNPEFNDLFGAVAVILAAFVLLSVFYLRPMFVEFGESIRHKQDVVAREYIERARHISERTTDIRELDSAFRHLRFALESAISLDVRNEAALAMGEYLVIRARTDPMPYALMARQYLTALLDDETRPGIRFRACNALVAAAWLMKDIGTMKEAGAEALDLAVDPDDSARILLLWMDLVLEKGAWSDFRELMNKAAEFSSSPRWQHEFMFREAMGNEQTLLRDEWFEQWITFQREQYDSGSTEPDARALRSDLIEKTLAQFQALSESGVVRMQAEALFRTGRLYFHEEDYEKARFFFGEFLKLEPVIHQSETLLMMTKSARVLGRMTEAEDLISAFLSRFPWETAAQDEFMKVIETGMEHGRFAQALELIENYSRLPASANILSDLLCKAGYLAAALSLYERAEEYYRRVIEINERDDLIVTAMLALVDICFEKDDIEGARDWLLVYLNRFPFEVRQGDALFALLDIDVRRRADIADIINVAVTAANECPEDPRTSDALMLVARKLENMGLFEPAAEQYNKVVLLHYVHKANGMAGDDETTALQAMLGNARCLMHAGKQAEAGHMLRKLCSDLESGPFRDEALYLWAMLALRDDQKNEARRRLELIDKTTASAEMAAFATIEKALIDMDTYGNAGTFSGVVMNALEKLDTETHGELIRRACEQYFEYLAKDRDIEGMQQFFDWAVSGRFAGILPVAAFSLRLGNMALAHKGIEDFISRMERNMSLMETAGIAPTADTADLIERARNIRAHREQVGNL